MFQEKWFMLHVVVKEDCNLKNWLFVAIFCFRTFFFLWIIFFLRKKTFLCKKIQKKYKVVDFFIQKWSFLKGYKSQSTNFITTRNMDSNYKSHVLIKTPFKNLMECLTGWRKWYFENTYKKKKIIQNTWYKKYPFFSLSHKYSMINDLRTRKQEINRKIVKEK